MIDAYRKALDSYYGQLEDLLWEALEKGKDLCVYGPVFTFSEQTQSYQLETKYKFIDPGEHVDMPCPYTIYHTAHMQVGRA